AWHTAPDDDAPDNVRSAQSITAGVLEVELPGATLAETATITVDWGTFFFRATATIIDLDA
ncbi:hypothetical protein, partial [Thioalkalivibrio sp.]|uniref:hypothetical protein n=1 Tax=Thioalkalivibrio sp. TaxID=2093813 RepID=UPI0035681BD6